MIRVNDKTKESLTDLKIHPRESYSEVIDRLVASYVDEEPLSAETLKAIRQARDDVRSGRFYTMEEAEKELGLE
ncbi:MAG: hypothetical protein KBA49_00435 [Methanolinea sp.]|nr:hypothetical protein [Methanolinea sp.]